MKTLYLNNQVYCTHDGSAYCRYRQASGCHHHHALSTSNRVAWCIGVQCRHRPIMTGIHRLKHLERFSATTLPHNDSVWAHTKSVYHELARGNFTRSFNAGLSSFKPNDMRFLKLQFGSIFYGNDTFTLSNETR